MEITQDQWRTMAAGCWSRQRVYSRQRENGNVVYKTLVFISPPKPPRNRGRTDKFLSHQLFFNVTLVFFFCFSSFWLLTLWLWDFFWWKIRKILLFKKKGEREGPKKLCVISRLQQRNGKWVNSRRVCLGPLHMWWCARPFCYHSTRLI